MAKCSLSLLIDFTCVKNRIYIGGTDAEAATLWPADAKSRLIGKDPDARKDWRQKQKGVAEDEMLREHHQLNGHESEKTPADSERQGSLV